MGCELDWAVDHRMGRPPRDVVSKEPNFHCSFPAIAAKNCQNRWCSDNSTRSLATRWRGHLPNLLPN
ncbi:hypothetical protein RHMOL_Rhmol06G0157500 [Rhododendron molle]|uniref:Uncharacterized protein n=1 Tax=Rhododendron molle TaxID=49168 RepID=A0ACC0NED2_RHOML|nr:hypothetical protein RHMOL_Rhmol06G0157500 [Rhododendron molle]